MFVDAICDTVGAPRPARIAADSQVNASAHLEGGLLGVVGGELILTIGLPIAAGLTLKQFAGVLAHGFGHFSQRAGMRLYVLIMMVNMWFARVVYERDSWDDALEAWSKQGNFYVIAIVAAIRLAVWITRRVFWVLMMFGHVGSGADHVDAVERARKARHQLHRAELALLFLKCNVPVDAAAFELKAATTQSAEGARDRAERQLLKLDAITKHFSAAAAARLTHALAIIRSNMPRRRSRWRDFRSL